MDLLEPLLSSAEVARAQANQQAVLAARHAPSSTGIMTKEMETCSKDAKEPGHAALPSSSHVNAAAGPAVWHSGEKRSQSDIPS